MSLLRAALAVLFIFSASVSYSQQSNPIQKEWTFLVFINGHNNLSSYGESNIIDMEKVGSTADVNIVVEWGSESEMTKRLYIEKSKDSSKVNSPALKQMKNYDMGDYKNLQEFIKWGVEKYPAKHYFITVWNHGSGWHKRVLTQTPTVRDISYDDESGNHITIEQLGKVLEETKKIIGHNVDIYGSDACLMQMIEVAGEMSDSVDYVVGSEETIPVEGWPYLTFLKKWVTTPMMSPSELSVLLSKEYLAGYREGGVYGLQSDITFSALDMSKLNGLYSSISDLSKSLVQLNDISFAKVKSASNSTIEFTEGDYKDLGDFVFQLKKKNISGLETVLTNVENSLTDVVLSVDNDDKYKVAKGLAIWIPGRSNSSYQPRYNNLKSSAATGWNLFTEKIAH